MGQNILTKNKHFTVDEKHLVHFLAPYEQKFLKAALPWVPLRVSTAHLTLMTIAWSVGIVMAGYLSAGDIRWLWLFNACLLMQYITDMLDGEVGRERHTGLIKWGFFMDHFLDYIFLSAIVLGYSFLLPPDYFILVLLCQVFFVGFMIHTFIDFAITNDFKISAGRFGVSEMRLALFFFNVLLIIFGRGLLIQVFPFVVLAAFIGLCGLVYRSQGVYRHMDALQQARQEQDKI